MHTSSQFPGWIPDLPDFRDYRYIAPGSTLENLPLQWDMRQKSPVVYYQDSLHSCTANAIAGAFQFELSNQRKPAFQPSVLFIYYNQRRIQNTVNTDSGASIRDGLYTMRHDGVCRDEKWKYVIHEFTKKPFESCYTDALKHKIKNYYSLDREINQMKACLADNHPVIAGFSVYESFFDQQVLQHGVVNMPVKKEKRVFGHAALVVGYDDAKGCFILRNSWGNSWGNGGYFTMPYEYLLDKRLAQDFWMIRLAGDTTGPEGVME